MIHIFVCFLHLNPWVALLDKGCLLGLSRVTFMWYCDISRASSFWRKRHGMEQYFQFNIQASFYYYRNPNVVALGYSGDTEYLFTGTCRSVYLCWKLGKKWELTSRSCHSDNFRNSRVIFPQKVMSKNKIWAYYYRAGIMVLCTLSVGLCHTHTVVLALYHHHHQHAGGQKTV